MHLIDSLGVQAVFRVIENNRTFQSQSLLNVGLHETPSKRLESCVVEFEADIAADEDKKVVLRICSMTPERVEVGQLGHVSIDLRQVIKDAGLGDDGLISPEGIRYTMPIDQC